jgi:acetyl esterase/lipase
MPRGDDVSHFDTDGTLHLARLTIPPSPLWSSQYKAFYAGWDAEVAALSELKLPARDSTRADWDRYDRSVAVYLGERLNRLLQTYPVEVSDTTIGGVHVGIVDPKGGMEPKNRRRVLINLHGGGFVNGRGLTAGLLESIPVASLGRVKVITVDYRQAPFNEYPAASEDVAAVYRQLLREYEPGAIGIYGCSAGGALAAQTVVWLQAERLPRPGAIGVFCTGLAARWTHPQGDSAMWATPIPQTPALQAEKTEPVATQWYMQNARAGDPKAYPDSSDEALAKFPPTLFVNGTRDFTMSSAIAAHAHLLKLGVEASLYIMEGGIHGAFALAVGTPEAHDANAYIAHWFDRHLTGTSKPPIH